MSKTRHIESSKQHAKHPYGAHIFCTYCMFKILALRVEVDVYLFDVCCVTVRCVTFCSQISIYVLFDFVLRVALMFVLFYVCCVSVRCVMFYLCISIYIISIFIYFIVRICVCLSVGHVLCHI